MTHTKVDYDVEPVADALHFLREPLDCENVGVSVLDCEPGWTGKEHEHADDGQEEVYVIIEGEAVITVEGEGIELGAGDALRVSPESTRQIRNGETESTFVLVGAP